MEEDKDFSKEERVSMDDLLVYNHAVSKSMVAALKAEKALSESKAAQAEAKYVVLSIFYKYKLEPGKDDIREDGTILRSARNQDKDGETNNE